MSETQRTTVMCKKAPAPQVHFILLSMKNVSSKKNKKNKTLKMFSCFSGFRSVSFTLHTNDVLSTVKNILRSCSLPTDHVVHLKATPNASKRPPHQSGSPFYRPGTKVNTSYTFSGFRGFEQELQHTKIKAPTLRSGR